ncbi:hypothetical protein KOAAANKH_03046 [Brevundimonas sp. NIBR10]|jgi:hypothetical protein|uniref:hypothetical protein n=1 Tax=unclassified Brevundimonas TaxID=2622653 RepID=UPI0022F1672F|nr:hypothetical protein [Brevundimonas sp. NIBR10]WGM48150.1 hypothetical protein KOAAANKH_03046 [Brevundimonas sp. NIBR10]
MNRNILIALTAVAVAACTPADAPKSEALQAEAPTAAALAAEAADQAAYDAANTPPTEPVANLAWRAELCSHLGGEIGGDGSERDREVQAQMETMRCGDGLIAEGAALKAANAADPAVVARIEAALKVASGE